MSEATEIIEEATEALPTHMELGDHRVPLKVRTGASSAFQLMQLAADRQTQLEGFGACIGFIWENCANPRYPLKAQYKRMGRRWADYGAAVVDQLFARGVPMEEIFAAGVQAYLAIAREANLFPSQEEVTAARGN